MSGGCQVDNLPSPLSPICPICPIGLIRPIPPTSPTSPTNRPFSKLIYTRVCAYVYNIKRLVGKSVIGLACDVECVITYKIIKFILQGCVFHILSVSLHRKSVR